MCRLLFMPLSCSDSQSESKERELKFIRHLQMPGASLGAQMVKNLPTVQETRVRSLGWEDPLEKDMTAHSSVFTWEIPRTEEPGGTAHGVGKRWTRLSDVSLTTGARGFAYIIAFITPFETQEN